MRERRHSRRTAMALPRSAAVCLLLALSGCAAVPTADGQRLKLGSAEFRDYVERVFREQNRIADALAFALEAQGSPDAELAAAEQQLLEACVGVNELATARRDQRRLRLRSSIRAAKSVPDCERAARAADARLPRKE
jgi:hypothetical protein